MSRVKPNDIFTVGLSGGFGKNTVFRHSQGKTYAYPKPIRPVTQKQLEARKKFQAAKDYAKAVLMEPGVKEEYTEIAKWKNIKNVTFAVIVDYVSALKLNAMPTEAYKGQAGYHLPIRLMDNYKAKEMSVAIANKDGTVMESGPATFTFGEDAWTYIITNSYANIDGLKILVTVKDRMRNIANFEKVLNS